MYTKLDANVVHHGSIRSNETLPITRSNFKIRCKRNFLNFEDFTELFSAKVRPNNTRMYYYVHKDNHIPYETSQASKKAFKEYTRERQSYYETSATTQDNFKTICRNNNWRFEDFVRTDSEKRNGRNKILYFYKIAKEMV